MKFNIRWSHIHSFDGLVSQESTMQNDGPEVEGWVMFAICDQLVGFIKRSEKQTAPETEAPTTQSLARGAGLPHPIIDRAIQQLNNPDNWWWQNPELLDQLAVNESQLTMLRSLLQIKVSRTSQIIPS